MPVAYLTIPHLKASLRGERLELEIPDAYDGPRPAQNWIPLIDLDRVVLSPMAYVSSRTLYGLLERKIEIIFMRHSGSPLGDLLPYARPHLIAPKQLDCSRSPVFRLAASQQLVDAKIRNMRRVLQRLSSNRKEAPIACKWLGAMARQALAAGSLDSLRGIEGAATGRYFETVSRFFPKELPFERRTRQPPHNEANAALSFTYSLLQAECHLRLRAAGLHPAWGVFHEIEDGRPSLALDIMEPFRAPVCDALVLDLFNHSRLKREHFSPVPGGMHLAAEGRRRVYTAWEDRLERSFFHEQSERRASIRQIIKDFAIALRSGIPAAEFPEPFIMN